MLGMKAMADVEYDVLRGHEGDKFYREGDCRTLDAGEAKHLVDLGVLRARKSEKAPLNKAEKSSPINKSQKG